MFLSQSEKKAKTLLIVNKLHYLVSIRVYKYFYGKVACMKGCMGFVLKIEVGEITAAPKGLEKFQNKFGISPIMNFSIR